MSQTRKTGTGNEFSGKYILITGGLGFIGSNLALRLVELGAAHLSGGWIDGNDRLLQKKQKVLLVVQSIESSTR